MKRLLAAGLLLAAGCSLPLPGAVHSVGEVPAEQRPVPLQVIPPGPRPGATPTETVLGFLGAQASSDNGHAIAREFLASALRTGWRDDAGVEVYDPDSLDVRLLPGSGETRATVRVTSVVTGEVRADGSYRVRGGDRVVEDYQLAKDGSLWRLDGVPNGLRLTAADRQRSFAPFPVYYLARDASASAPHLVPDYLFLPVGPDQARTLVARLLRSPSRALAGSVGTAIPTGARLRRFSLSDSGTATVDLSFGGPPPSGASAASLSAQLVWTLRSLRAFHALRLLGDGQPLAVPGEGDVQSAGEWAGYDPDGLGPNPPYYFSAGRRLRASVELPANPATAGEVGEGRGVAVDAVAVTTDRTRVALLDGNGAGTVTVREGSLLGTSFPVVARGTHLTSPTWGDGQTGLWLLRDHRQIVRLSGGLRPVPVSGLPAGPLQSLALSRDGARVAMVVAGHLYVGQVQVQNGLPRVVGLVGVLPAMHEATRVAWSSSTEVAALGVMTRAVQLVRVAVDGSSAATVNTAGLDPIDVAASPAGIVLVSGGGLYLSIGGGAFQQVQAAASAPTFPG